MSHFSNAGTLVSYGTTGSTIINIVGNLWKVDEPSIKNPTIEVMSHNTLRKDKISGRVTELGDMKLTIGYDKDTTSASLIPFVSSGSTLFWKVAYTNAETWLFQGILNEFKPLEADITSPDDLKAEITISCSGSMTLA